MIQQRIFGIVNSQKSNLAAYNNHWYNPGRNVLVRLIWHCASSAFVNSAFPFSGFKIFVLRTFGASIGKGVVVKPNVNVKYPWRLKVGDYTWIGENVWIDNLTDVTIGSNCCLSQGSFILTGNHDYSKTTFDLKVKPVTMEDGTWLGAKAVLCPGVTMHSHSVLAVGSVATSGLESYSIYQGVPAVKVRERVISN
jgi:putative colanic acid biosynthesis acetyltransferase WcaF